MLRGGRFHETGCIGLETAPRPTLGRTAIVLWFALVAPFSVQAQYDTASVLGTVHDVSGGVITGASITLRGVDTGSVATTKTDSNGDYQFSNVRIGSYEVTAEQTGFSSFVVRDVVATVNARLRVDVTMKVGSVSEQVVVNGTAAALETDSSERGQVI